MKTATTTTTAPVPVESVRADRVTVSDVVWFQDWDGDMVGGPVEAMRMVGDDVQFEVRTDFGRNGRMSEFETSRGNGVFVSMR